MYYVIKVNDTYEIPGEISTVTGDGYTLDVNPLINAYEFRDIVNKTKDLFYNVSARGLVISMTAYNARSDWWLSIQLYYEYGVNDITTLTYLRCTPFKPNIYESPTERKFFYVDIIRFTVSIVLSAFMLGQKVSL